MNKRLLWILTGICFLSAISFVTVSNGSAQTLGLAPASNAYDVIATVNSLRASRGLPGYNVNSVLMQIAQSQADYLASTGGANGHIGPGGTRPIDRALAAGYPVSGGYFSENWLGHDNYSAYEAVNAWMGDAPHQNTMLSPNLADIGAGVAMAGDTVYFVIDCGLATNSQINTPSADGGTVIVVSGTAMTQDNRIAVAIVSTPDEKGNIYHIVQPGQTLWQIALAYKTTIEAIKQKNHLSSTDIFVGQKLFIAFADTPTPVSPTVTATRDLSTATLLPTLLVFTETPTGTATALAVVPASSPAGGVAVIAIIVVALFAAGMVAWAGRSRPV